MARKVFVQVPSNSPSGGIKVANQLVNLFREHDYESYVVLPHEAYSADWLIKPAPTINIARMQKLCEDNDIIVDNWPDKDTTNGTMIAKARTKVFYMQGCTFLRSKNLIGDDYFRHKTGYTHFWVVSNDSLEYLKKRYPNAKCPPPEKWYLVNPYFDFKNAEEIIEGMQREDKILAFSRKGRSYIKLARMLYGKKSKFTIISHQFTEKDAYRLYAAHKFFLSTAVGVDPRKRLIRNMLSLLRHGDLGRLIWVIAPEGRREGFPLPPAEAAMCGSIVIGFAMGGGLEWMSPTTCFLAKDRSYFSLMKKIKEALSASDKQLDAMRENAFRAVSKFNKEHTWQQIKAFLNQLEG